MTFDLTPTMLRALPRYRIRRSSRARHVNLTINPTDGLVVVIPRGFDVRLIPGLIHEQRNWIDVRLEQLSDALNVDEIWQPPEQVVLPAVNETWTIGYRANPSATVRIVSCDDKVLRATGAIDNETKLRAALRRWLKRRAQATLPSRVAELAGMHGFNCARITIRHQRSRWGSCSTRNTISLNAKLMFVSAELVDHVLLHELCHTVHAHHGDAFQNLLASLTPNHRQQRTALRKAWSAIPSWAHR